MALLPSDKNSALNENQTSVHVVKSNAGNDKKTLSYDDSGDIYNYPRKIRWAKNRLTKMHEGQKCIQFLDKLKLVGLSDARLCYYGDRFPTELFLYQSFQRLIR